MNTSILPETLSVQRLFGVAVVLKIGFAAAGFLLDSPVWLGTVAPLTVMVAYMYLGYMRRSSDVSEERFADSCYYLGFIFTIVSIIICLFDLPKIAPGKGMYQIAMRFGAAMVSTVLGMIVRVYLVGFRKDVSEAVKDIESALIDATRAFTGQLQDTMRSMQQFEAQILDASKASVAGVQLQVEALGRDFAEALGRFYEQVNTDNKAAFEEMLGEVRIATARLAASVDTYSSGMRDHLQGIEAKVTSFSDAVTARLSSTTFPDDFFSSRLAAPVQQLKTEAESLGESVRNVAGQVSTSGIALGEVLDTLRQRTESTKATMDSIVTLSDQHRTLLNNADLQLNSLGRLAASLETLEGSLRLTTDAVKANSATSSDLQRQIGVLAQDSSVGRGELREALEGISKRLEQTSDRAGGVMDRIDANAATLHKRFSDVATEVRSSTESAGRIVQQISAYSGELPKLVAASAENTARMQRAVDRVDELARAATAAVHDSSATTRSMQEMQAAMSEQSRELTAANLRLCEAQEKTAAVLAALLHRVPNQQPQAIQAGPSVAVAAIVTTDSPLVPGTPRSFS